MEDVLGKRQQDIDVVEAPPERSLHKKKRIANQLENYDKSIQEEIKRRHIWDAQKKSVDASRNMEKALVKNQADHYDNIDKRYEGVKLIKDKNRFETRDVERGADNDISPIKKNIYKGKLGTKLNTLPKWIQNYGSGHCFGIECTSMLADSEEAPKKFTNDTATKLRQSYIQGKQYDGLREMYGHKLLSYNNKNTGYTNNIPVDQVDVGHYINPGEKLLISFASQFAVKPENEDKMTKEEIQQFRIDHKDQKKEGHHVVSVHNVHGKNHYFDSNYVPVSSQPDNLAHFLGRYDNPMVTAITKIYPYEKFDRRVWVNHPQTGFGLAKIYK